MKQAILLLAITFVFSCNDSVKKNNNETTEKTTNDVNENKNSANVKDKEDFMSTVEMVAVFLFKR